MVGTSIIIKLLTVIVLIFLPLLYGLLYRSIVINLKKNYYVAMMFIGIIFLIYICLIYGAFFSKPQAAFNTLLYFSFFFILFVIHYTVKKVHNKSLKNKYKTKKTNINSKISEEEYTYNVYLDDSGKLWYPYVIKNRIYITSELKKLLCNP